MNKVALTRWILFLLVGLPFQMFVFILYPLIYLYWRIAIYKKPEGDFVLAQHQALDVARGKRTRNGGLYLDNDDDHSALSMFGFISKEGLDRLITEEGDFIRRVNEDWSNNMNWVSGDAVINWSFAVTALEDQPKEAILRAAWRYLINLGTRSNDPENGTWVSNRCNNFGINYCPDSEAKGIGQPMAGPQFYTNACLFALASQYSVFFKFVFWTHWVLLGGWYWAFSPAIHSKDKQLIYVRDSVVKALYVMRTVFGNKWWIRIPSEFVTFKMSNVRNDLWFATQGLGPVNKLPECMNSFFSQEADATSKPGDRTNGYLGKAIEDLALKVELMRKNGK